ncbi:nucleoside triphosphate pyrophosphohydrolase family protein [Pseudemcibacter aquimaris]|uniref:nucleoside triphosphate pyrophosphohydrolase family protein n=1 Tax=Pseudemcibacter aquimaris TaxID=2857064 RepID=UPI00201290A5|nr:nucleoside triphosphate pyrophosphohydrolase family protein [Pseudemcibacter aquimaris]MCC3859828.1 nucleoside triphosphate pyrophosphohydrolase family protein [Pseudemcibacter aquimaris]WDU57160.1 nucleoside triphosphate pyrophosphohydrolase family protein [Pseudemcibacter aquimaris]
MKNYLADSARTASNTYFTDKVTEDEVKNTFEKFAETGEVLDNQKRRLFYGKGDALSGGNVDGFSIENLNGNIVHAIYGLCTEAGEISEAFLKAAETGSFDEVNLKEEAGDLLWYLAMLFRELDTDFDEVATTNINKLKARFPEKFTQDHAYNRDLGKEREILES